MFIYVLLIATLSVNKVEAQITCADFATQCQYEFLSFTEIDYPADVVDPYCIDGKPTSSCLNAAKACAANDNSFILYSRNATFKNYVCGEGRTLIALGGINFCLSDVFTGQVNDCLNKLTDCEKKLCYVDLTKDICGAELLICNYLTIVKDYTCEVPNCPLPITTGTTNELTTEVTTSSIDETTIASSSNTVDLTSSTTSVEVITSSNAVDFTSSTTNVEGITSTKAEYLTSSNTIYGSSSFAKTSDPTITNSNTVGMNSSKSADPTSSNNNAGVTSLDATTTKVPAVSTALGIGLVVGCAVCICLLCCCVLFVIKGKMKKWKKGKV